MQFNGTPEEIWREIPGYHGLYEVSDSGSVRSWYYRKGGRPQNAPLYLSLRLALLCTLLLIGSGCGRPPTPEPTPTPIPGFVAGEEKYAYDSFIAYYKDEIVDCTWTDLVEDNISTGVDEDYVGTAAYVGDGIWRFHIQTWWLEMPAKGETPDYNYREETVQARSLPNRTWENMCNRVDRNERNYDYDPGVPDFPP